MLPSLPKNLDMDVLRTLVTATRLGGQNRAARAVGRSQSAVSQQLRRLEEQVGEPLFTKQGRGLVPTSAGEVILRYATRILELNDEAMAAVRGETVRERPVRFGVPEDLAEIWLPHTLRRFHRDGGHGAHGAHGAQEARIEVTVDRNAQLVERLDRGELDLVVAFGKGARRDARRLASVPLRWIAAAPFRRRAGPLAVAMAQPPCFFRRESLEALDRAGVPWTMAFSSPGLIGLFAAVRAGLGITARPAAALPPGLRLLDARSGLPALPTIELCVHDGGRDLAAPAARLRDLVTRARVRSRSP